MLNKFGEALKSELADAESETIVCILEVVVDALPKEFIESVEVSNWNANNEKLMQLQVQAVVGNAIRVLLAKQAKASCLRFGFTSWI